jgi:signal transduction histidine kinase
MAVIAGFAVTRGPRLATLVTTALLVFAAASVTTMLGHFTGQITGIWIANAVLLSFLLKCPRWQWPQILAAGLIGNLAADATHGYGLLAAFYMSTSNLVEVVLMAAVLRGFKLDREFARPKSLLWFYALAAGPAPVLSAALATAAFHFTYGYTFFPEAFDWYAADALGLVIFTPLLMTVRWRALRRMFAREEVIESVLLVGVAVAAILLNFFLRAYPFAFLFFPVVVLLTFRRGFAGGAIGLLLSGGYLLVPALFGDSSGPLRTDSVREQVMIVQIFVAVMAFSVVLIGAALEERKRLERGLASAIKRVEMSREEALVARDAAQKANRAKSMFLANMSHELRTPLNAVIGFAEVMHDEMFGPLGDPHYREYTGMIQGAGRHLLELINDVLDMSKIEAGKFEIQRERVAVGALVEDCIELVRENAGQAGVEIVGDIGTAPIWANADRRAVKQILLNLLSNAVKFTPSGGKIVVCAAMRDGAVVLSVSDTGIGIPADQLSRLGNPFVQLRGDAGTTHVGTGLGLALVRSLAELHNGTFRIDSVEGVGTKVSVGLPAARAASLAA